MTSKHSSQDSGGETPSTIKSISFKNNSSMPDDIFRDLENKLGLKESFIIALQKEDDWSFIIKLHSLLEAALTHEIIQTINNEKLKKHIEKLNLNGPTGKVSIADNLDLLHPNLKKYISALSEIRNEFVHSIEKTNSTILDYYNGLTPNQKNHFLNRIAFMTEHTIPKFGGEKTKKDSFLKNPREVVYLGVIATIIGLLKII